MSLITCYILIHQMAPMIGSDIVYLSGLGMNIIVLNSLEATSELFDKRSQIYNDR